MILSSSRSRNWVRVKALSRAINNPPTKPASWRLSYPFFAGLPPLMIRWSAVRIPPAFGCFRVSLSAGQDLRFVSGSSSESTSIASLDDVELLKSRLGPEDEAMISLLMDYKERHGDCHIPTGTNAFAREERRRLQLSEDLANWAVKQRIYYRRSQEKKGKMTDSLSTKIIVLESMGFIWSCREAQWQRAFNRLEDYFRKNANLRVHRDRDAQMWTWMDQQRKSYQKGQLCPEREALLREIGFVFDPNEFRWWDNYQRLCVYRKEHGDTLVPVNYEKDLYFGKWVARQRRLYHAKQLSGDRIQALNDAGFTWDARKDAWEKYYNQLCDFYSENKHTRVPKDIGPLWNWVDRQRRSYKENLHRRLQGHVDETDDDGSPDETRMTNSEMTRLSNIGFEWDDGSETQRATEGRMKRLEEITFEAALHDEKWMKNFQRLCEFKEEFGHFAVPNDAVEYKDLSTWVRHQRYLYKGNRLADDRLALLNDVEFAWTAEAARWDRMFEALANFYAKNGHARIPVRNGELYRWTKQQKRILSAMNNTHQERETDDRSIQRLLALHEMIF